MLWTALTTGIVMCQIAVSHYVPPCPLMAINRHRTGVAGMSACDRKRTFIGICGQAAEMRVFCPSAPIRALRSVDKEP